ncbi:MAG: hypothetical protein KF862_07100 [Chitinophagaceae bacterium]|nr:hypothetical protein [Chitinophagaceae bacterium]
MITYNTYPSLLFLSYDKDSAPEELPFEVDSIETRKYLEGCQGYQEMFGIMASLNSFGQKPTHYWINNKRFNDIEYSDSFRNSHFRNFLSSLPVSIQYGCICFKEGGQYVYLYLPADKDIKKVGGAYIATALFKRNAFIGFEEAVLDGGFGVMSGGFYKGGMDRGGYLSFVSISLSFFRDNTSELPAVINNTKETLLTKQ